MDRRYTKADLEKVVYRQLENLNAMHELLLLMQEQNNLIERVNKKLNNDLLKVKNRQYALGRRLKT